MRSNVFLMMLAVCLVAIQSAAYAASDNVLNGGNLQTAAGTLTTTKAPVAPPVPAPDEPKAVITTSTAAPSSSATLNQPDRSQQGQSRGQHSTPNQGEKQSERGNTPVEPNILDVLATTTTKAATPLADAGTLTDNTDHSSQRQQIPAPRQPPTTTTPGGAPGHQNPTPSKDADAGGQTDKGKQQAKTSTPVADDVATQTVLTNSDKEINVAQTSVTSTSVPTRRESTSPTTLLPNLSNAMQHADKKDNTIGSSSLFALAALVTFVMITVAPAY